MSNLVILSQLETQANPLGSLVKGRPGPCLVLLAPNRSLKVSGMAVGSGTVGKGRPAKSWKNGGPVYCQSLGMLPCGRLTLPEAQIASEGPGTKIL